MWQLMENEMSELNNLRLESKLAEVRYHATLARLCKAELETMGGEKQADENPAQLMFSPGWKVNGGVHLSKDGQQAILQAFDERMSVSAVSRLFRITTKAADAWKKRHAEARRKAAAKEV